MSEIVLACYGLEKCFNDGASRIEILKHIDLSVQAGEMIAIIGNSGSGKSTLLHLLGGLDTPTKGRVVIKDQCLADLSENQKCYVRNHYLGFIYQFHHLQSEFTALENVSMPLLIRGLDAKQFQPKVEHLLESVGLKDRMTHRPSELSGGERQRVAIARALITDPLCILADEPTGDLDPRNAEQVFQIFMKLQAEHKLSVIMVTHDIGLAKKAHRTMTLVDGRLESVPAFA